MARLADPKKNQIACEERIHRYMIPLDPDYSLIHRLPILVPGPLNICLTTIYLPLFDIMLVAFFILTESCASFSPYLLL